MTICESLNFTQFCLALQPLQIFCMSVASSSSRSLRHSSSWSTTAKLLIKILDLPNAYSFALIGSSRSKYVTPCNKKSICVRQKQKCTKWLFKSSVNITSTAGPCHEGQVCGHNSLNLCRKVPYCSRNENPFLRNLASSTRLEERCC